MSNTMSITLPTNSPVGDNSANVDEAAQLAIEGGGQEPTNQPNQQAVEPPEMLSDKQAQDIANEVSLDVQAIENHWLEHGTIPEAELAKLATVGITSEMAQDYIAYRHAQAEQSQNEFINEVGGNEAFEAMSQWAASSWNAQQLEAYNAAIDSGNKGQIQLALKALKAEYMAANPPAPAKPKLVHAQNFAGGGVQAYKSLAEAQRDFTNPLYNQDPAFREQVGRRLAVSNIM